MLADYHQSCLSHPCEYQSINLRFFVPSNLSSPYKDKLSKMLSLIFREGNGNIFQIIPRMTRLALQKQQHRKQCVMVSSSILQKQSGFNVSLKPCLSLCLRRQLKPNLSLANIFIRSGSLILKIYYQQVLQILTIHREIYITSIH